MERKYCLSVLCSSISIFFFSIIALIAEAVPLINDWNNLSNEMKVRLFAALISTLVIICLNYVIFFKSLKRGHETA